MVYTCDWILVTRVKDRVLREEVEIDPSDANLYDDGVDVSLGQLNDQRIGDYLSGACEASVPRRQAGSCEEESEFARCRGAQELEGQRIALDRRQLVRRIKTIKSQILGNIVCHNGPPATANASKSRQLQSTALAEARHDLRDSELG